MPSTALAAAVGDARIVKLTPPAAKCRGSIIWGCSVRAYDAAAPRAPLTEHSASKVRRPTLRAPRGMCRRSDVRAGAQGSCCGCARAAQQNLPD
eukprot:scaffold6445_cov63-Phaeocystis_antarctica.AAC.3